MKKHKILIVDDDREHNLMVAFMCRQAGYEVISAVNAQSALQMAIEQNPDLLLLDVHMEDADGYAVQERLQQIDTLIKTPVIYLTGETSSWVECMVNVLGANGVFRKPFKIDELLAAIETALTKKDSAAHAAVSDRRLAGARAYQPRNRSLDECSSPGPDVYRLTPR